MQQTRRRLDLTLLQRLADQVEDVVEHGAGAVSVEFAAQRCSVGQRIDEGVELGVGGLADRRRDKTSTFSGGMKRRLNFGCGIVHAPRVLLLDEPTAGVDPQSRVKLLDLVREQARAGTTVVYTTHYMEEAQELCDRIAIVDKGKLDQRRDHAGRRARVRLAAAAGIDTNHGRFNRRRKMDVAHGAGPGADCLRHAGGPAALQD